MSHLENDIVVLSDAEINDVSGGLSAERPDPIYILPVEPIKPCICLPVQPIEYK